ncbi:MAG TPA: endolytic transglycosylase MltG [Firmicutes bacterium]|nr:endolytic transglycosylase MltG [Bacillota bacterium]
MGYDRSCLSKCSKTSIKRRDELSRGRRELIMKKRSIIFVIAGIFAFFVIVFLGGVFFYTDSLKAVDPSSNENITFEIKKGEPANIIIENLKKAGLIKNDKTMKLYVKMNPGIPQAGTYIFSKSMSAKDIYSSILDGKVTRDTVWVTFVEGKRLSYIEEVISKNFEYTKEEIESVLDDDEYIRSLIDKYSFLTEDILNDKIYHPLEGYLFADTYEFLSDATIKDIIERMLDNTESKLSSFSQEIENSELSIHEIMTLASIVELEGARSTDRDGVAGVFYNRLKSKMSLGSDVTTYYAVGKDFSKDLTMSDLNTCNGYNTRGTCVKGLPVGPIATPSLASIKATLKPDNHDYLFFVADKNGKTYFSKTNAEHDAIVRKLRSEGLWYEY